MATFKLIAFLLLALIAGATLVAASVAWAFPTGWFGALILTGWAILTRRR